MEKMKTKAWQTAHLRNCTVKSKGEMNLFDIGPEGDYIIRLDGYAVIPLDEYEQLMNCSIRETIRNGQFVDESENGGGFILNHQSNW